MAPSNVAAQSAPKAPTRHHVSRSKTGTVKPHIGGTGGLVTTDMDQGVTKEQMAQDLLGGGVAVSNVTYTGANPAGGTFSGGNGIIGFDDGIILSSGFISNVIGPNTDSGITGDNQTPGDADLDKIVSAAHPGDHTFDAAVLEFDFVPTSSTVAFQYVFASDEYPEFVGLFNDVFAFYLNGENIALVPGTTTPVSINTINPGNPGIDPPFPPTNPQFYVDNNFQAPDVAPINTEMDGLTTVLTAKGTVTPGKPNHIKLAIADTNDQILDSNVFLRAGSLFSGSVVQSLPSPERIVDTRSGAGPINTGNSKCFAIAGVQGIPGDAAAVVLNVTAVGYGTNGWLTIYPNGQVVPATSTLNFDTHEYALANGVVIPVGTGGQVCVNVGTVGSAAGNSQVVLDATGFLSTGGTTQLSMLPSPQRLVDTRSAGGGGPIQTGLSRCFTAAGIDGIPSDAAAVLLNVTAVGYGTRGWLTAFPNGQAVPATSTLNFDTTEYAMANGTLARVGNNGQVCINVGTVGNLPGNSEVVLDATGYLSAAGIVEMPMLTSPARLVDTRSAAGPISTGQSRCFTVAGMDGIPGNATSVVANLTAVDYQTQGWLTAYPSGEAVPATSTLNFDTSEYAMANGALIPIGTNGQVCVQVGTVGGAAGKSDVILDAVGWVTP